MGLYVLQYLVTFCVQDFSELTNLQGSLMALSIIVEHGSQESFNLGYQAHETQCLDNKICPMWHTMRPTNKKGMPLHELGVDTIFHPL